MNCIKKSKITKKYLAILFIVLLVVNTVITIFNCVMSCMDKHLLDSSMQCLTFHIIY